MKPNHKQTYQINNLNPIQIDLIHIHANQSSETSDHVEQGIDLTEWVPVFFFISAVHGLLAE